MADREKVIEGLENLRETIRTATQYTFTSGGICAMSMKRIDNAISLLKEQKAVKPTWQQGKAYCGSCGKRIPLKIGARFCHKCGQAVKWE